MLRLKVLLTILVISLTAVAQPGTDMFWKKYRLELIGGLGVTNFLSDLGGGPNIGTHYFRDLNFRSTRLSAELGFRYKFSERVAIRMVGHYMRLFGDDKLTDNMFRNYRNLTIRTDLYEGNITGEYSIFKEQLGHRYRINGVTGRKVYQIHTYFYGGLGLIYFNPQGIYKGKWYDLRNLGTEGQGMYPGKELYSQLQLVVPVGIGFRYSFSYRVGMGAEIGYRKTFTDYLDDVSSFYADKDLLRQKRGQIAVELSDPSIYSNTYQTRTGEQRGNPTNTDSYFYANVTFYVKIKTTRKAYYVPLF